MGNTIVCPLSAESRGDRDSSGHRQRRGGRPPERGGAGRGGWGGARRGGAAGLESGAQRGLPAARAGGSGTSEPLGVARSGDRPRPAEVQVRRSEFPPAASGSQTPAASRQELPFTSLGPGARETPEGEVDMEGGPHFSPGGGTVLLDRSLLTDVFASIEFQNFFFFLKVTRGRSFYILSQSVIEGCLTTTKLVSCGLLPIPSLCPACSPEATKPLSTPRAASGICLFLNNALMLLFFIDQL